jgi:hypothetical protein
MALRQESTIIRRSRLVIDIYGTHRQVELLRADLDPVWLLAEMREQQRLVETIADGVGTSGLRAAPIPIDAFLAGLRLAWQKGEIRPTAQSKPKQKRGRRQPDPLAAVSNELHAWFGANPACSDNELLAQLQTLYPVSDPDALLRTVQRRRKSWRHAVASKLVLGMERNDGCSDISSGHGHKTNAIELGNFARLGNTCLNLIVALHHSLPR